MKNGDCFIFCACCSLMATVSLPATGATTALLDDGRTALNGEPIFFVGLYELPKDDFLLRDAVAAGFNLFRSSHNEEALDRIAAAGAHAWIPLGHELDLQGAETDTRSDRIKEIVNRFKDHPALALWEGPDEALWNVWYSRLDYFWRGQEFRDMAAEAEALPEDQKTSVLADIPKMRQCLDRALWSEFDALRASIWERLGRDIPRPELAMDKASTDAFALGDGLAEGIRILKETDPNRIFWYNHAPRNSIDAMRHHNRSVDMAGCDIYPVPQEFPQKHSDLHDQTIAGVGAYTRRMREAAPGKAVAMVLQGFGWADILPSAEQRAEESGLAIGRRPLMEETRFMAYSAIVNGANALMYWGTHYIEKDSALWRDLRNMARELKVLQPWLAAENAAQQPASVARDGYGSVDDAGPLLLLKQADNTYLLIAVNEAMTAVAFSVEGLPEELEGRSLYRLGSDETVTVQNGAFKDGISGQSVLLYATENLSFKPQEEAVAENWRDDLPESIRLVLDVTSPLSHSRGNRLPLYLWPAMNPGPLSDAVAERLVAELDRRGIGLVCSWYAGQEERTFAEALPIARAQRKLGLPVNINATQPLYSFFDGDERTAHVDSDGTPFWDASFGKADMGCPFALEFRKEPMKARLTPFIERYKSEDLAVHFVFADWEIDGPLEWNGAWESSKRCTRCREQLPDLDNFLAFQHRLRKIRSELQREVYATPVLDAFPKALVGNYAVYPNNGFRYWYDYFETMVEGQPEVVEQRARYRHWANEFETTGYTFAMPVVYPWSWTYDWYDFNVPDYRWFYNMLKVASNAGQYRQQGVPNITFVHWHTVNVGRDVGDGAEEGGSTAPQLSEWAYQELLWHMLLRGHDTFFLWCMNQENEKEVALLHPVWAAAQEYGAFLEHGEPVTFDIPNQPGTVISGLRLDNRVLVRRTDFMDNTETVTLRIGTRTLDISAAPGRCIIYDLHGMR